MSPVAEVRPHGNDELMVWLMHDLRGPLAGILAMAESLEDGVTDDPVAYFRQIQAEVRRMAGMLDDLSDIAAVTATTSLLKLERVSLADLVQAAIASADPVAHACGVDLTSRSAPMIHALVDPAELSRAMANLLLNAIRHTPSGSAVTISLTPRARHVEISVTDSCGGMTTEALSRSFESAWQGPERTSGSGLGLAIVKGIVEAHHGAVSVENETSGCRFMMSLPLSA